MHHDQGWAITPDGVRRELNYVPVHFGFHRNLAVGNLGNFRRNLPCGNLQCVTSDGVICTVNYSADLNYAVIAQP